MNTVKVPPNTQICVVGDIHEHPEQFFSLVDEYKPGPSKWVVSVGDVYDKGWGTLAAENITKTLMEFDRCGYGFAVKGNHEYKITRKRGDLSESLIWWAGRPISLSFEFESEKIITVVHGGIAPKHEHPGVIEALFTRDVDEKGVIYLKWVMKDGKKDLVKSREGGDTWHNLYDGRFGYVIAGHHPHLDGPKFYKNSCNIDTGVFQSGILCGQIINIDGSLGQLLKIKGEPFKLEP